MKAWRCIVCGYIHEGPEPPEACPVCGAGPEDFEPVEQATENLEPEPTSTQTPGDDRVIVIVGAGIAGVSAADAARKASERARIVLVDGESTGPYYRLNLTRLLNGELGEDDLPLHPEAWYRERRIERIAARALRLDAKAHHVALDNGETLAYDRLVLTVGARPFVPEWPGVDLRGVGVLRTLVDARRIMNDARKDQPVVGVGGGLLGLETAGALAHRGAKVTVLERANRLLARQLNEPAAAILRRHVEAAGIEVRTEAQVEAFEGAGGALSAVRMAGGERLPATTAVLAAGVRPDTDLARAAGAEVERGLSVDAHMATTLPDVFAAGDCAAYEGILYGIWEPARRQGLVAGACAAGGTARFEALPPSTLLKVLSVKLASLGRVDEDGEGFSKLEETTDRTYRGLFFRDDVLVGAILLGDTSALPALQERLASPDDPRAPRGGADSVEAYLAR